MPRTFRLDPAWIARQQRVQLARAIPIAAIAGVVGFGISWRPTEPGSGLVMGVTVPVMLCAMGVGLNLGLKRSKAAWQSYELIVAKDTLTRRTIGLSDIVMSRTQISEVVEARDGAVTIHGQTRNMTIGIPAGLADRAELMHILESWCRVERRPSRIPAFALNMVVTLVSLALFATALIATIPWVVVSTGLACGFGLLWCAWSIWKSPHVDVRTKRTAWVVLFPAFSAFGRVYHALWG